jgi:biotin operon repressor
LASGGHEGQAAQPGAGKSKDQIDMEWKHMERNPALTILKVLRHSKTNPITDVELRNATGLSQTEIDLAAEELESEGMVIVERTYTLAE